MPADLGSAYFQLVPSMAGFSKAVTGQLAGIGGAGSKIGVRLGADMRKAFQNQTKDLAATSVAKLTAEVQSASKVLATARSKEADVTGRLRIAEQQLAETRAKYKAESSQVIRAEERVASATRSVISAQSAAGAASEKLATVDTRLVAANDRLAASMRSTESSARRFSSLNFSGISGGLNRASNSAGKLASGFGDVARTASGFVIGNVVYQGIGKAFDLAAGSVIGFNAQLEQSQVAFSTMLGSGQKAQKFLDQLQQFAKSTPFTFPQIVTASQRLLAMGIKAKNVIPYMTGIGDAVAGIGGGADKIDQVVLAIGQINAKGKVQGDEILQLTEAGIPALKILADAYHTTTGQISSMISKGQIASDKAIPALISGFEKGTKSVKGFGGLMAKQSLTFTGAVSNISDSLNIAVATAFRPFFNILRDGAVKLGNFLQSKTFQTWSANVTSYINDVINRFKPLGKTVGDIFAGKDISNTGGLGAALQPIIDKLKQLPPDAGKSFDQIGASLKKAMPDMLYFAQQVGPGLVQILDDAVVLTGRLAPVVAQLSPVLRPLADAFKNINSFSPVTTLRNVLDLFNGSQTPAQVFKTAMSGAAGGVAQLGARIGLSLGTATRNIVGFVITATANVNTFASRFVAGFVRAGIGVAQGMATAGRNVTVGLARIIGAVIGFGGRVSGLLVRSGQALIDGFIRGIQSRIGAAGAAVSGVLKFVQSHFPQSPAKRGPFSGSGWTNLAKSGGAVAEQFTGGFNDGVRDFAKGVGGMLPGASSSITASLTGATKAAGTSVLISNKTNVRLEDLIDTRIVRGDAEAARAQRLGYQPVGI